MGRVQRLARDGKLSAADAEVRALYRGLRIDGVTSVNAASTFNVGREGAPDNTIPQQPTSAARTLATVVWIWLRNTVLLLGFVVVLVCGYQAFLKLKNNGTGTIPGGSATSRIMHSLGFNKPPAYSPQELAAMWDDDGL